MKLVKTILFLSLSLWLIGCGKTTTSNNTTNTNTTNTAASPKATASPASTPAQTTVSTPEDAAKGLLDAWKTKDETAAAKFATAAAFKKLFTEGGGPAGMQPQGCSEEAGTYNCAYTYEGGALIMFVKGSASAGYKVDSIEFIAD